MAGERELPGVGGIKAFWTPGSNGYRGDQGANWRIVSALLQGRAKSASTTLPGTGTAGDIYILPPGAVSNANEIAVWDGESGSEEWNYIVPAAGWKMFVIDADEEYIFDGSIWEPNVSSGGGIGGIFTFTGFDGTTEFTFEDETIHGAISFTDDLGGSRGDWFVTDVLPDAEEGTTQSLRSPDISHNQWTAMQFDVDSDLASAIRVRNRPACEGSDRMEIFVDSGSGYTEVLQRNGSSSSGTWAWSEVDLTSYSGTVSIQIRYVKDVSGNFGYDSLFVSQVDILYAYSAPKGAVVEYRGRVWVSTEDDNEDTPGHDSSKWRAVGFTDSFFEEETGTTYSVTDADLTGGVVKEMNDAGAITITVPPDLVGMGNVTFIQTGAGGISFAAGSGVTILSDGGKLSGAGQYTGVTLIPKGSDTFYLVGALS